MKAIILAAGEGSRMGTITKNTPKPLVDVNGTSILERQLILLKQNSVQDIVVITGPNYEKFDFDNITYLHDKTSHDHDQLGSLMCAKDQMNDDVVIIFGDIIFNELILQQILNSKSDITMSVDMNWKKSYQNRTDNLFEDADKVLIKNEKAIQIFKKSKNKNDEYIIGEFIGLIKFSKDAIKKLITEYEKLEFSHNGKFHDAESLQKAKLIDILQELLEKKIEINTISVSGKWCEIDTVEDLAIAKRLFS